MEKGKMVELLQSVYDALDWYGDNLPRTAEDDLLRVIAALREEVSDDAR